MSISILRYVDINSGVGGASTVAQRELILRLFTTNDAVAAGSVAELTTLADVQRLFGTDSEEYRRATSYFGWISKSITAARKISFAHWANDEESPTIRGAAALTVLATWKTITDGAFNLQVGTEGAAVDALNFSGAASLADVAGIIQAGIRAENGANFSGATVTYDAVAQRFNAEFPGADTLPALPVVTAATSGTSIVNQLGWGNDAVFGGGSVAQSPLEALTESTVISDNFATYGFIDELTLDQWEEIGAWNQAQNIKYMALVPVTYDNSDDWYEALGSYSGVTLTLVATPNTEHDEDIPGIILAATDYTKRNAVKNYMYQEFSGKTAKVIDDDTADALDALRVNYYGQTQTAGQKRSFYQTGVVCGTSNSPSQMGVFANEIWFKSRASANLLQLLLALEIIPATDEGRAIVLASLQEIIDAALFNGTIATGKDLTVTQKLYINQITGDERAWHQVQNIGYWVDAAVTQTTGQNGVTKYQVDYTLLYSKADAVNKITGRDILI